jgi:GrpB-like predicted nucleotidyltransferase (UPF0157 family)
MQPYNEQWPAEFDHLAQRLRRALDGLDVRVDHVGSTSVPGLSAKDVIDVQITVHDLSDTRLDERLVAIGVFATDLTTDHVPPGAEGNMADWTKRYFRAPPSWRRTHLHVREDGRANQRYALLFRDYLRNSATAAIAYERVKSALARLHPNDVEAYYDVKDPVCDLVIDAAERWAADSGWSPQPN